MEATAGGAVPAWQLLVTSATPTITVCLLGAVGALMAHKGALDSAGCQVLARMCFFVFTPALTFSKIVQAVSFDTIAHLWPLIANMTACVAVGLLMGLLVARTLRAPPHYLSLILLACSLGNVGNFPLVFVATLCHDKQAVFYRTLGASCEHLGVAYTAFDIATCTIFQFTLAINLIRRGKAAQQAALGPVEGDAEGDADGAAGTEPPLSGPRELKKMPTLSDLLRGRRGSRPGSGGSSPRSEVLGVTPRQQQSGHSGSPGGPSPAAAALVPGTPPIAAQQQGDQHVLVELQPSADMWQQQQQQHLQQRHYHQPSQQHHWQQQQTQQQQCKATHSSYDSAADDDRAALLPSTTPVEQYTDDLAVPATAGGGGKRGRVTQAWTTFWGYIKGVDWNALFPLPSQAAFLGILVGCIPPLKAALYSDHPPLRVIGEALDALGTGLIPTAIPLLGAVLYRASSPGASRLPLRVTLGVLATKLIIAPALLTLMVVGALALKLFRPPDAMFLLTILLSNATPTAVNMQTLTVLYQYGEAEMSSLLQWQYLASILTLPAFMSVFLRIIEAWV